MVPSEVSENVKAEVSSLAERPQTWEVIALREDKIRLEKLVCCSSFVFQL